MSPAEVDVFIAVTLTIVKSFNSDVFNKGPVQLLHTHGSPALRLVRPCVVQCPRGSLGGVIRFVTFLLGTLMRFSIAAQETVALHAISLGYNIPSLFLPMFKKGRRCP